MFVLLEHNSPEGVHWDFMVEAEPGSRLLTWRLAAIPVFGIEVPVLRIGDHRRLYLEYEGDIGGGRGWVRRIDGGESVILGCTAQRCDLRLHGRLLRGMARIVAAARGNAIEVAPENRHEASFLLSREDAQEPPAPGFAEGR